MKPFSTAPRKADRNFRAHRNQDSPGQRFRYDPWADVFLQYVPRHEEINKKFVEVPGTWHLPFFTPAWWSEL